MEPLIRALICLALLGVLMGGSYLADRFFGKQDEEETRDFDNHGHE